MDFWPWENFKYRLETLIIFIRDLYPEIKKYVKSFSIW